LKLLALAFHDPGGIDKALAPPAQRAQVAIPASGALRFHDDD
jgi:hypothetical protein